MHFLGITSTFWEVNVSCSRIQHGDPRKYGLLNTGLTVLMLLIGDPIQDVEHFHVILEKKILKRCRNQYPYTELINYFSFCIHYTLNYMGNSMECTYNSSSI